MIYQEHASLSLMTIFSEVHEIGTTYGRKQVTGVEDFIRRADSKYHSSPIYADVFDNNIVYNPTTNKNDYIPLRINKMFFDFDFKPDKHKKDTTESDLIQVRKNLIDRNIPPSDIVKEWTRNGYHLYAKLKPLINPSKEEVVKYQSKMRALQTAVSQCNCSTTPHLLHSVDTAVFGEFSRIGRVPGYPRSDNKGVPVVVSAEKTTRDWLYEHKSFDAVVSSGNEILWNWGQGNKSLDDIYREEDDKFLTLFSKYSVGEINIKEVHVPPIYTKPNYDTHPELIHILQQVKVPMKNEDGEKYMGGLSEQFIKRSLDPMADNNTRVALGTYLLEYGFHPSLITNLMAMIGWYNFNYGVTYAKLNHLFIWRNNKRI